MSVSSALKMGGEVAAGDPEQRRGRVDACLRGLAWLGSGVFER